MFVPAFKFILLFIYFFADTSLPLIISLCVVFVLIIGTITVLILLKRRHTGQFR